MRSGYGNMQLFNIAADMEINQYIKDECLPEGGIKLTTFPTITHLKPNAGTHYYYEETVHWYPSTRAIVLI